MKTKTSSLHLAAVAIAGFLLASCSSSTSTTSAAKSSTVQEQEFSSPDQAAAALITALRTNDQQSLQNILGPEGKQVLSSGDPVADQHNKQDFLADYNQKNQLQRTSSNSMTLVVGNSDWPMPIPIVKDDATGKWYFDTAAGDDEILSRRIGRNELDTIQTCRAIVDAQEEYAERDPDHVGIPVYADRIISDPGLHNGLYWKTTANEEPSPLGELVADAVEQGYGTRKSAAETIHPYHGYYYRLLTQQGPHAKGGARSYIVRGKLLSGFGVLAYPAEYGNSGIMTFIVNQDGTVYQKDLGPQTESIAKAITSFDPGRGWQQAEQQ